MKSDIHNLQLKQLALAAFAASLFVCRTMATDGAFVVDPGATSVEIPDSVTFIAYGALDGLPDGAYDETTIPGVRLVDGWVVGVTEAYTETSLDLSKARGIAEGALDFDLGLTSLVLPTRLTRIDEYMFWAFRSLTSLKIPDGVTSVDARAFDGCPDDFFDTTTIPGVKMVDGWVVGYTDDVPAEIDLSLTSVRGIADGAFQYCDALVSVTLPSTLSCIGKDAFSSCTSLAELTIPASVTVVGEDALFDCLSLRRAVFAGAPPQGGERLFGEAVSEGESIEDVAGYYEPSCYQAWRAALGDSAEGLWNGLAMACAQPLHFDTTTCDPMPELTTTATTNDVAAALSGSGDERLVKKITNAAQYARYRQWVERVTGTDLSDAAVIKARQAVKASAQAWLAYALDLGAVPVAAPKDGDLKIASFETGGDSDGSPSRADAGNWSLAVSLDGFPVGANAAASALKEVFVVEGAASLDGAAFGADNVNVTFGTPVDGRVKVSVAPSQASDRFFIRVKLAP